MSLSCTTSSSVYSRLLPLPCAGRPWGRASAGSSQYPNLRCVNPTIFCTSPEVNRPGSWVDGVAATVDILSFKVQKLAPHVKCRLAPQAMSDGHCSVPSYGSPFTIK